MVGMKALMSLWSVLGALFGGPSGGFRIVDGVDAQHNETLVLDDA
jgi:hypothetical protein